MSYLGKCFLILCAVLLSWSVGASAWAKMDAAELRLAQAEFERGSQYFYGRGVEKDLDQALSWYLKSAEKGQAKSELAVGQVLAFGDPKNRKFQEALPWFIKAERPHAMAQISGAARANKTAAKNLKWLCRKGLVEFPDGHALAENPKCWVERGDRLFHGIPRVDYYLHKDKKKYYGEIKKDYAASRDYLERAFAAGETEAAINLAEIYRKGLGIAADAEKAPYYTQQAASAGHGKSNYALAEQALEAGKTEAYFEKLETAAKGANRDAYRKLAWAYYEGEGVAQNYETAFKYFFLRGQYQFVRDRDTRRGDVRLPFFENKFLSAFQTDITPDILDRAHRDALKFADDNDFGKRTQEDIARSYRAAISDLDYVKETGGQWYRSDIFMRLMMYLGLFVMLLVIRNVASAIVKR